MAVGKLFHIIHMTGDYDALEAWYKDVFSVYGGWRDKNYIEIEKRDASLQLLGDTVIEPLAPAFRVEGWETEALGRFYTKFGPHWHSIAWYTDDAPEMWDRATSNGIRVLGMGGVAAGERPDPRRPIMTHPKDTITQLEFFNPKGVYDDKDPRLAPAGTYDYDPDWWIKNHPVKTPGLAYFTVTTRDLDRATEIYGNVLGGTVLHKSSSELTGTDDVYIQLGDTVVQLSTPNHDGTIAAADMEKFGETAHAAAFKVQDLDETKAYFDEKGIKTLERDDHTLITDPETTHGAIFRWTTWDVPGGPRDK